MDSLILVMLVLAASGCVTQTRPHPTANEASPPASHDEPPATAERDPEARRFAVYSLWIEGQGDEHRAELDQFDACLLDHSSFGSFWSPAVSIEAMGSWVVPKPATALATGEEAAAWLAPMVEGLSLPAVEPDVTPIYLVYGDAGQMERATCGYCDQVRLDGREVGLAVVRTGPPCWPGQGPVRSLTQYTEHELSCAIEVTLGEEHCAADGRCEGGAGCPLACDSFTGLYCPGAPEQSYTGCDGNPVRGWVVQKLRHRQAGPVACDLCSECDFTVEAS